MAERTLWNCYNAEPVEDGGFVIVHRHCVDNAGPGVLTAPQGSATFHAYRVDKDEAEQVAADRNQSLGDGYVPYPFNRKRG
jgi:hypothetical protein